MLESIEWLLSDMLACNLTPDSDTLLQLFATYEQRGMTTQAEYIKKMLNLRQRLDEEKQRM